MSRDSQAGKESRTQRNTDNPKSGERQGEPSSSLSEKAAHNNQKVIKIPKNELGRVIGRKGKRKRDIMEQSGVEALVIRDDQVRLTGTEEQCTKAEKIIYEIIRGEGSPDVGSWKKLDFIPEKYMGVVIGKNSENLKRIEQKTGATLMVYGKNGLYVKRSPESQKRAIREIKEQANIGMKLSRAGPPVRLVHVDTTQLDQNLKFELSVVKPPNDYNADETKYYELKQVEDSPQDMKDGQDVFTDTDKLRDELLNVLKNIYKEKEEEALKVVVWCHLGHAYIKDVSEDDEKADYFTLAEIKEKLEEAGSWKTSIFEGGLDNTEIERIEKHLESRTVKEDIRYDFTFLTPSCRDVRVKAWLTEDAAKEDETISMAFSRNAPVRVKNILIRALPDGQGRSYVAKTPEAEEGEDKILKNYLMGMKIEEGRLVLPPVSALPDGFDLSYQRCSRRKTYQCEMGEQFSLIVCKDQANTVDAVETEVRDVHTVVPKTDIHLHCEYWDRALAEGNDWDPEQIVDKLPSFLQLLREVEI